MFNDPELLKTISNVYTLVFWVFLVFYAVLWYFKLSVRHKIFPEDDLVQVLFWVSIIVSTFISLMQWLGNVVSNGAVPPFAFYVNLVYVCIVGVCAIVIGLVLGLSELRKNLPER